MIYNAPENPQEGNNNPIYFDNGSLDDELLELIATDKLQAQEAECTKGLSVALDILTYARDLDNRMRNETRLHALSRRFALSVPGGTSEHPFAHELVVMQPQKSQNGKMVDTTKVPIETIFLRFGLDCSHPVNLAEPNGQVLITYRTPDFKVEELLSSKNHNRILDTQGLFIEDNELNGVQIGEFAISEPFEYFLFEALMETYEPALRAQIYNK